VTFASIRARGSDGFSPPDRTLFDGVFQVPPGHYILATPRSFRLLRYWDFDYPSAAELAAQKNDDHFYVEQFRAAYHAELRAMVYGAMTSSRSEK
jgi:asparagine synthetase B (glutamine-hydrolysing)